MFTESGVKAAKLEDVERRTDKNIVLRIFFFIVHS
jgi:hypothetical protein